jgi:apolipoprotein N-acyltransferase
MATIADLAGQRGATGSGSVALFPALSWPAGLVTAVGAVAGFHLAQWFWGGFILVFLYGVVRLTELGSGRKAFYTTVAVGYAAYVPHAAFLWIIFGAAALVLWGILALWLGVFVVLARGVRQRWGARVLVLLAPWLWLGTEYFRSELYYLRFSWLSVGYAFAAMPGVIGATGLGVYGTGFGLMGLAGLAAWLSRGRALLVLLAGATLLAGLENLPLKRKDSGSDRLLEVAGVQLEFPSVREVTVALDEVVRRHPETELIVLSEYTFLGPIPDTLMEWCKREARYVVVGGQDPIDATRYYNTAFVIGPSGEVVFRQVKSVPIQFFQDGEPAVTRAVWESPWGRLGIAICYDLSYRRVVDDLVVAGAEGLIIPVMDVADWGIRQRELHGRVGPVRAAEYGLPIFRLCSSGISQVIDGQGRVLASGSFPGAGEIVTGALRLKGPGRVPWDARLGPIGVLVAVATVVGLACGKPRRAEGGRPGRTEGATEC